MTDTARCYLTPGEALLSALALWHLLPLGWGVSELDLRPRGVVLQVEGVLERWAA